MVEQSGRRVLDRGEGGGDAVFGQRSQSVRRHHFDIALIDWSVRKYLSAKHMYITIPGLGRDAVVSIKVFIDHRNSYPQAIGTDTTV